MNSIWVSNSLNPDQALGFVELNLGPKFLLATFSSFVGIFLKMSFKKKQEYYLKVSSLDPD